jgi:hypothetical protein
MAVVRARSSPPYALIVFVFLTVIFAGLWIWTAVSKGDSDTKRAEAEKKLQEVYTAKPDEQAFMAALRKDNAKVSAMAAAQAQLISLKKLIDDGAENKSASDLTRDISNTLRAAGYADGKLLPTVRLLHSAANSARTEAEASTTRLTALDKSLAEERGRIDTGIKTYQDQTNEGRKQLLAAQEATAAAVADKEKVAKEAQDELTKVKEAAEKARVEMDLQLQDARAAIKRLEKQVQDLLAQIKPPGVPDARAVAAGKIVRVQAGAGECYINIGRKDRVTNGLTFVVHDATAGVRGRAGEGKDTTATQGDTEAAGKGSLEVIQVGENESRCRITRTTKGQVIQAGDLIANFAYTASKDRKSRFVVAGDFDLDGDGASTAAERDRVISMITSTGGTIDEKLSPQTDFLVLGTAPKGSAMQGTEKPAEGSPEANAANAQKAYEDLMTEAKRSGVGILNLNRFLAMVGYYDTSVVR